MSSEDVTETEEEVTRREFLAGGAVATASIGGAVLLADQKPAVDVGKWRQHRSATGVEAFESVESGQYWLDGALTGSVWKLQLTLSAGRGFDDLLFTRDDDMAPVHTYPLSDADERTKATLASTGETLLVAAFDGMGTDSPSLVWCMDMTLPFDPRKLGHEPPLGQHDTPDVGEFDVRRATREGWAGSTGVGE